MLEDIDRIEVIRGPGATLWGANAVNGVINIITKSAKDTQGTLLTVGSGDQEPGSTAMRYGGRLGKTGYYRVFGKYFNRRGYLTTPGQAGADRWHMGRGGFRIDTQPGPRNALTVEGEYYSGQVGQDITTPILSPPYTTTIAGDYPVSGANILGRWKHTYRNSSDLALQMYYDRTERKSPVHRETRDTVDLELQHRFLLGKRNDVLWGAGYRYTRDHLRDTPTISWMPDSRGDSLFSGFIQDDLTLKPNRVRLTLGSKFEHNDYTGFEVEPNVRILWTPDDRHTVWAAISRSVRTPARFEYTVRANQVALPLPSPPGVAEAAIFGDAGFQSEGLIAYEMGCRSQVTNRLFLDLATFYNVYDHLRTFEPQMGFLEDGSIPHLAVPQLPRNEQHGQTAGVELAANWNVTDRWRLGLNYTWLAMRLRLDPASRDPAGISIEGDNPRHQLSLQSYLDLPNRWSLDTALYYVDQLPNQKVPAYVRLDLRLGWQPTKALTASLGVQNLFSNRHTEFGPSYLVTPAPIPRSVFGKLTWSY